MLHAGGLLKLLSFNSFRVNVVGGGKAGSKETFMNTQRALFRKKFTRSRCHFFTKMLKEILHGTYRTFDAYALEEES